MLPTFFSRANPSVLDNQSGDWSPGKTNSPSLSSFELLEALHLGAGPHEISPIYIVMPTVVQIVQVLFRQPCCCHFMGIVATVIAERYSLPAESMVLWLLESFHFIFGDVSWTRAVFGFFVVCLFCSLSTRDRHSTVSSFQHFNSRGFL